jgi:hypothetical protein
MRGPLSRVQSEKGIGAGRRRGGEKAACKAACVCACMHGLCHIPRMHVCVKMQERALAPVAAHLRHGRGGGRGRGEGDGSRSECVRVGGLTTVVRARSLKSACGNGDKSLC